MKKEEGSNSPKKSRLSIKAIFFFNRTINCISAAVIIVTIVTRLFLKVKIHIGETALLYFFSSIAQSMAAIIALGGTVAIFRYQFLLEMLNDSRKRLKEMLATGSRARYAGFPPGAISYCDDDELLRSEKGFSQSENLTPDIKKEIKKGFDEFNSEQSRKNSFVNHLKPLFISLFATFVLSVFLIPLSGGIANLAVGIYFWELFTFLIVNTSYNLYYYFVGTATLGKNV